MKNSIIIFSLLLLCACDLSHPVSQGVLEERSIEESAGLRPKYKVIILDEGCNCKRTFDITTYESWVSAPLKSRVQVRVGYGTELHKIQ